MADHDEQARRFITLLGAHDRRLFSYILALVPNYADAEEIAQQVRLRLWQQFDQYDPDKDFGAWARTIAYYLILADRKDTTRKRMQFSTETIEAIAERVGIASDQMDDRRWALQECLGRLSESKRQLLMLYYSSEDSLREIAEQLGRSFEAVRRSLLRTRIALADCITRALRREEMR